MGTNRIDLSTVPVQVGNEGASQSERPQLVSVTASVQPAEPKPSEPSTTPPLSQQSKSTIQTPSAQTITSSPNGSHPHLNDDLQEPIQSMLTRPESRAEQTDRALRTLKDKGIIDDNGKILCLGHKISGTIFNNDGSFDFHIEGPCGNRSVKELQNLKNRIIGALAGDGTNGNSGIISKEEAEQLVRNIIPEAAGPLSPSDLQILNSGGCLQYRGTEEGFVKMALDPKEEGALTLTCFERSNNEISEGASQTIPAPVVFEGKEANGYKVEPPTLPHWKQRLEAIRQEDQQKSQLAQNDVWNAVTRYLSGNRWGFNISNGQNNPEVSNGQNGANALGSHANNNNLNNAMGINRENGAQNLNLDNTASGPLSTSRLQSQPPAGSINSSIVVDIPPEGTGTQATLPNNDTNQNLSAAQQNQQNNSAIPPDNANSKPTDSRNENVKSTDVNKEAEATANSQKTTIEETIDDINGKISKVNEGQKEITGITTKIKGISPNDIKIITSEFLYKGRYYNEAMEILRRQNFEQPINVVLNNFSKSDSAPYPNLRALTIGIARLKDRENYLKKALQTTDTIRARGETENAIRELTNVFIALAKTSVP